ncbi:MAG: hypothetical protein ACI8ZM_002872 [Crocinitomix sp.]|jgi:hypothetical protein
MRIHSRCSSCKAGISHYTIYDTRIAYEMRKGSKHVSIQCKKCRNTDVYHLNDLRAVRSPWFGLVFGIAIVLGLISTFILGYYVDTSTYQWTVFGLIAGVPLTACGIMFQQNMVKVNAFNRNFVSD